MRGAGTRVVADGVGVVLEGRAVLSGVELAVDAGELVALVGPNGAGKSTLLHVLAGDVAPTSGSVTLDGRAVASWRAADLARIRSVLTQSNEVSFPFTVREVVAMGLAPWTALPPAEEEARIDSAVDDAELAALEHRRLPELSGGEQARAAWARVRAQGAGLVLLDEPTASLDIRHQERLLGHLRRHTEEGGSAVVVVHDLDLAAAYSTRVVVLEAGRVRADGPPADALDAALLSAVYRHPILVHRVAESGELLVRPARTTVPLGGPSHA
ncbi:heme ABC transporter ATP-binding protein [Herbiconiux sp. CPCC 205716]|uniref:Heme ABC transporter ATP-binding protein n=1 Tax=Herbiconiux gentiana TaxID=2970912 RepID=A0ABT2GIN9_9MICO|nr:heme ABC transporter ATP-binding protein [Herbiconiux gentiana]MCS5716099.1 heme ABC transporter ATP-binding protein [Herbiconiux gentiana]